MQQSRPVAARRPRVTALGESSSSSSSSSSGRGSPPSAQQQWGVIASPSASVDLEQSEFVEAQYPWRWNSSIRWYSAGGSGPVLLLVHGFGVGGYHFERNFAQLSQAGFRVFALDLLGQGGSWPAEQTADPDPELGPLMYRCVCVCVCWSDRWCLDLSGPWFLFAGGCSWV